jgi:hypothetical protein
MVFMTIHLQQLIQLLVIAQAALIRVAVNTHAILATPPQQIILGDLRQTILIP